MDELFESDNTYLSTLTCCVCDVVYLRYNDIYLIEDMPVCSPCLQFNKREEIFRTLKGNESENDENEFPLLSNSTLSETLSNENLAQCEPSVTRNRKDSGGLKTGSDGDLLMIQSLIDSTEELSKKEEFLKIHVQQLVNTVIPEKLKNPSLDPSDKNKLLSYLEFYSKISQEITGSMQTKTDASLSCSEVMFEEQAGLNISPSSNVLEFQNEKRQIDLPDVESSSVRHSTPKTKENLVPLEMQQHFGNHSLKLPSQISCLKSHEKKYKKPHSLPYETNRRNKNMSPSHGVPFTNNRTIIPSDSNSSCQKRLDFSHSPNSLDLKFKNMSCRSSSGSVTPEKPAHQDKHNFSADQILARRRTYSPLEIETRHAKSLSPCSKTKLSYSPIVTNEHRVLSHSSINTDSSSHGTIILPQSYSKENFETLPLSTTFRCVEFNSTKENIVCNKCQQQMKGYYVSCSSVTEHIFCFPCVRKYIQENNECYSCCPSGDKCFLRDSEILWIIHDRDLSFIQNYASPN